MRNRVALIAIASITLLSCSSGDPKATDSRVDTSTAATSGTTSGSGTTAGTTDGTDASGVDAIDWQSAGEGIERGTLEVPIDYENPEGGSFTLALARHLATDPSQRIGTLLVNPGGPGFGGTDFAVYADQIYSQTLLEHFDILGWDPRGTGTSTPAIDCIDDYDKFYASSDITPDDDAERQHIVDLAKEFEDDCSTKNADIIQHVGTNDSARDMDSIRRALGEETITYFGFSYGSELGATWATLFPNTVRAAVLDGAADPTADFSTSGLQQSEGFEQALDTFLAKCSANAKCAFHSDGDAEGAFDALMQRIDEDPLPSEDGRPPVSRQVALNGVAQAMYSQALWPQLEQALADAENGDGKGLLALHDMYFQRQPDGSYDNSLEAFQTITCMDTPERPTVEEEDAEAAKYTAVAPRFSPGTTGSYFCTFYPATESPRVEITGKGAGPILVVGTTGDPATPLSSTETMAKTLENGVLLVVEGDQHTGYGINQCSYDTIDGYLVDLTVPAAGTRCSASS